MKRQYCNKTWYPVFDEAADAAAAAAAAEAEAEATKVAAAKVAAEGDKSKKLFTQDEVNRIAADNKRALQVKNEQLIKELDAIKKNAGVTAEQKQSLEQRIEELQNEVMTKEELSKKEQDRLHKEQEKKLNEAQQEANAWKTRYTVATVERAITDAAVSNKAINPRQVVAILGQKTYLAEERDPEGQPTGNMVPKVKFDSKDKDGKTVPLDISIPEAVKQMKEMEDYYNLFQGEGVPGLGAASKTAGSRKSSQELAKNPAAYREARRKGTI